MKITYFDKLAIMMLVMASAVWTAEVMAEIAAREDARAAKFDELSALTGGACAPGDIACIAALIEQRTRCAS